MYKVFINDKPIIFTSSLKNDENFPIYKLRYVVFEEVIHKLRYSRLEGIYVFCDNEKKGFKKLLKKYNVIVAGGGLVKNKKKELLLIYRTERWDLPKGRAELGESIEETAVREVEEECGIFNLKIDRFLLKSYHIYNHGNLIEIKETHWFLMTSDYVGELTPQVEEGITKVCFKNKEEIPKLLENTYGNIKLVFEEYAKQERLFKSLSH